MAVSLQKDEIELTSQDSPFYWPNQQHAPGLTPAHLIAGGDGVIVILKLDDMCFHLWGQFVLDPGDHA